MVKFKLNPKNRRWRKILVGMAVLVALIVIGCVITVRQVYNDNLKPASSSQKSQLLTIPSGATVKEISQSLKAAGLIKTPWAFEWYVRNNNLRESLQAGTYSLRPSLSIPEIARVLTEGKVDTSLVTILPAQRLDQIKEAFINKYGFDPADVEAAFNPDLYRDHPALVDKPTGASLEGYIYPETFQKTANTKPSTIVRASLDEMQKHLTPDLRAGIVRQGLTVHQGVILASIIEQEVGNAADKPTVSQVFLKRLRESKPLESDATTDYGAILVGKAPTPDFDSDYNTYKRGGLPPTPISNVDANSLAAVANPNNSDYLFFVSGDDGTTHFSHTLAEHEALTKQYCKKLCN